jgi:hypothetical protein
MSSWGNNDNAANAPYWAVNSSITHGTWVANNAATPTAANVALLYANTTSNAYITGETIGLFGIDAQEIQAQGHGMGAHAGWNLTTTGSGGRAGRVQTETLVALANLTGDGDAQTYANVSITLTNPSSASGYASSTNANSITFSTTVTELGNQSGVTYQWQINNNTGGTWVNVANNVVSNTYFTGGTTNTLNLIAKSPVANGYVLRVIATANNDSAVTATTANATVTIFAGA